MQPLMFTSLIAVGLALSGCQSELATVADAALRGAPGYPVQQRPDQSQPNTPSQPTEPVQTYASHSATGRRRGGEAGLRRGYAG
ncbi:hypothetical protein [Ensifer sp. LCM 4579]|uniref:hypothetical protein n=1 Tax=Ensifer sp. LCM 4579 TaxID=1848292 RepID=UPI001FCE1DD0|nr:hypothetical protein [Ensifer sp. LCM 4579]